MRDLIAQGVRVQMCVTSPPYWGLRSYLPDDHPDKPMELGLERRHDCLGWATGNRCGECYVCHMVEVFRLVRELLSDDGTLWLNLGDSYAGGGRGGITEGSPFRLQVANVGSFVAPMPVPAGLKAKDLVGIPWRVAFALQADGWWLRQDIIWSKPNPMTEPVRDRCTKSHEYVFLLSKNERYYFDADAIAEPASSYLLEQMRYGYGGRATKDYRAAGAQDPSEVKRRIIENKRRKLADERGSGSDSSDTPLTRNKHSVWTVTTRPFRGAHVATFPPGLIEPCILAGSRPGDIVLDPFLGSGTTAQVAQKLGRQWIGCEINQRYIQLQHERLRGVTTGLAL